MDTTHEYSLLGISDADAAVASSLAELAVRDKEIDKHARDVLADLLLDHGQDEAARRMRDRWNALVVHGDGSLCLEYMSEEGDVRDIRHIGWHNPTAFSWQRVMDAEDACYWDEVYNDLPF